MTLQAWALVAPSILAADFSRLGEEVCAVDTAGADWFHMDGWLVPNITIEVDGDQTPAAVSRAVEAGADAIVAGSSIFGSADYSAAIAAIRQAAGRSS